MYHRGTFSDFIVPSTQRNMHLSMMPNPSHLEGSPAHLGTGPQPLYSCILMMV